jgi:hypothetical protein
MFNRDKSAVGPQSVEITLEDGKTLKGKLVLPPGRSLPETLNGGAAFIEFEPFGGERTYLAKSSLRLVRPMNLPPQPTLATPSKEFNDFDPHSVLGVGADADKEQVRRAYLQLAKIYHPDRYATIDLPHEVREYLAAMARRINAAHEALTAKLREQPVRPQPVFTTPARS